MLVISRTYVCTKCFSCYNKYKVIAQKGVVSIIGSDNNDHSVFLMYYHLVLVIKYRKEVFDTFVSERAKETFDHI